MRAHARTRTPCARARAHAHRVTHTHIRTDRKAHTYIRYPTRSHDAPGWPRSTTCCTASTGSTTATRAPTRTRTSTAATAPCCHGSAGGSAVCARVATRVSIRVWGMSGRVLAEGKYECWQGAGSCPTGAPVVPYSLITCLKHCTDPGLAIFAANGRKLLHRCYPHVPHSASRTTPRPRPTCRFMLQYSTPLQFAKIFGWTMLLQVRCRPHWRDYHS